MEVYKWLFSVPAIVAMREGYFHEFAIFEEKTKAMLTYIMMLFVWGGEQCLL